jgi:hypothetical protein
VANTSVAGRGNRRRATYKEPAAGSSESPTGGWCAAACSTQGPIQRCERGPPPRPRSQPPKSGAAGVVGGVADEGLASAHRRSSPTTAAGPHHPSAHR